MRKAQESFIIRVPEFEDARFSQIGAMESTLELAIALNKIHLFDAETRVNLIS